MYTAYSNHEIRMASQIDRSGGHYSGIEEGKKLERKSILKSFAKDNLFGITKNANGSAYFQNGIKLDLNNKNLIQTIVTK